MPINLISCKNCEELFNENHKFCPHCGQQSKEKLTVGLLFANTIKNYFSVDARFFKSFFPLLFKPGYLANRFVEGKRSIYLHPAQLYLFISIVFFFLLSITVVKKQVEIVDKELSKTENNVYHNNDNERVLDSIQVDSILKPFNEAKTPGLKVTDKEKLDSIIKSNIIKEKKNNKGFVIAGGVTEKQIDSMLAIGASEDEIYKLMGMKDDANVLTRKFYAQVLKFSKQKDGGQIIKAIYDTIPIALFILLPIFALILKIMFFKRGSYAYHLVFSFYFYAFLFTAFSLLLLTNYFFEMPFGLNMLIILSTFFYLLIAVKKFYKKGWLSSFFRTSFVTGLYFTLVIPIAISLIAVVGFLFY